MKNRWGRDFVPQQRNLEEIEKREVVIGAGKLSDESVSQCLAANMGWERPSRFDLWADRALMVGIAYIDFAAVFLVGFLIGYVLSAFRG